MVQAADVTSLLEAVQRLGAVIRREHPELPDVTTEFLIARKKFLHALLEDEETKNPALAAKIQQLIDGSCKNEPFDYD